MKNRWFVAAALLASALPAAANWGGSAGGSVGTGSFKPFGTAQVEMQREELNILLYHDHAKVQVHYVLKNTGDAVDVKAGFPCLGATPSEQEPGVKTLESNYLEIEDYRLTVNGHAVSYRTERGELGNWKTLFASGYLDGVEGAGGADNSACQDCRIWWLTSRVHFDEDETKQITIEYESNYEYIDGGFSDDSDYESDTFRYLLSTASAWKGPIQQGRVTIKAATVNLDSILIKPEGRFKRVADSYVWEFSGLNPTMADNIEVSLNNKFSTVFNYEHATDADKSWYSFEGDKYYFDFHGYTARASSEKPGYPVANIADTADDTAWVAGKNGGIGESFTLTLVQPTHVDQIGIVPGFAKSRQLYFANNRIEQLDVSVNGGPPVMVMLPDEYISFGPDSQKGYHLIDLGTYTGLAKTLTLTVRKVYPGSRYNDTCISEILLRKRLAKKPTVVHAR
ncbi:MAG: NADase-type glycan-binding domain-containing protein [Terracidiphilus sp.]